MIRRGFIVGGRFEAERAGVFIDQEQLVPAGHHVGGRSGTGELGSPQRDRGSHGLQQPDTALRPIRLQRRHRDLQHQREQQQGAPLERAATLCLHAGRVDRDRRHPFGLADPAIAAELLALFGLDLAQFAVAVHDVIDGGAGNDFLRAGAGDDVVRVGGFGFRIEEMDGRRVDTVRVTRIENPPEEP